MKAMILAAGRGERMGTLTDQCPKPLLKVNGKALIEFSIEKLVAADFKDIVINIAYLGKHIQEYCGNGTKWGASIVYSDEGRNALETAGGIKNALPLLGGKPFLVVNADVFCDFPLNTLRNKAFDLAHLILINNPPHHPQGDFGLQDNGLLTEQETDKLTFSGIGVYHPTLFDHIPSGPMKLRPVLAEGISNRQISGEKYTGLWVDIGTPQRLAEINAHLRAESRILACWK